MEKKGTSSATMGVLIALILIVCHLVVYFADLWREMWAAYLIYILFFIAALVAVLLHAKENDNHVTFGSLFSFGFKTTAATASLMVLYTILFNFIFPDSKAQYLEFLRQKSLERPGATEQQADQMVQWIGNNYVLFSVLGIVFWFLVLGAVASLIAAAVSKKRPAAHTFDNI